MKHYPSLSEVYISKNTPFDVNFAGDLEYLRKLDCDRMLFNFRAAFGVKQKAEPIYGWDAPDDLLRGHSTGHFISALALAYSATRDPYFRDKLAYIVSELHSLQSMADGDPAEFVTSCTPEDCSQDKWSRDPSKWGRGFLSAYSPDQFALLEQFTPYAKIWAPYYTLHKLIAGLIEAYERTDNHEALETACGIGDWIICRLEPLTPEHRAKMWSLYIAGEYGGMNESLARLALITGERKYMDGAAMFDNANIFPGLSMGEDTIRNHHANQHIPQIMGALLEYKAGGNEEYFRIAENFFNIVTAHHMYSIGGVGQGESFREPDMQAHFIKGDTNCETCATYNLLKIARELYSYAPDHAEYMDYTERGLFNHILASRNPEITENMTSGVTYMLPIGPGCEKSYTDDWYSFTCCHGTGMENHVKYGDSIYFIDGDTVYVNEYVPSVLDSCGIRVKINTDFPYSRGNIIVFADREITLKLRIPSWQDGCPFKLNDESESIGVCGRYAVVRCAPMKVITIDVDFDYSVRLEYLPDMMSEWDLWMVNKNTHYHGDKEPDESGESLDRTPKYRVASVMYGPFVMAACDGAENYLHISENDVFTYSQNTDGAYGRLTGRGFSLESAGRIFRPIYELHGEPYHTYFVID